MRRAGPGSSRCTTELRPSALSRVSRRVSLGRKLLPEARSSGLIHSLKDHPLSQLLLAPDVGELLKGATIVEDGANTMNWASDFSYAASCYAGDHFRLVGDGGGTLDVYRIMISNKVPSSFHRPIFLKWV